MKFRLDTPVKRVGMLLLVFYICSVVAFAVTWNVTKKPFFYLTNSWGYETPPKPTDAENKTWLRSDEQHAWHQVNNMCHEKEVLNMGGVTLRSVTTEEEKKFWEDAEVIGGGETFFFENGKFLLSKACLTATIEDKDIYRWDSSLRDFLEEVMKIWPLSGLLFLGILFIWGVPDQIYRWLKALYVWIKTGKWERAQKHGRPRKLFAFKILPTTKRTLYGIFLVCLGSAALAILKYNDIRIGFLGGALFIWVWLWAFSKVTGLNLGFRQNKK